ncbi:MAG TPA: T9SS type A sorting domain-containing protein [Bacteroidetes bacterium]|nr:T9SS type A sorting domain-containing protein [Bacteroidota bacterium]
MKQFMKLKHLRNVLAICTAILFTGLNAQAQQGAETGSKQEKGKATVMIVKTIDGKTTIEEKEIDLADGEVTIEKDGNTTKIIRRNGDQIEVEVSVGDGDSPRMIILEEDEEDVDKNSESSEIYIERHLQVDGEKGKSMKMHTIKVVNGDTVLNTNTDGAEVGMIWIDGSEDEEGNTVRLIKLGNEKEGKCENVQIHIIQGEDGDMVMSKMQIVSIFVSELDEEEIAKYAPNEENNLKVQKVEAYPNPNDGMFNLSFKLKNKNLPAEISINGLDGKEVYRETVRGATKYDKKIDLREVPAGIYLLRILQGSQSMVKKLVIE